jgi:predicted nucleotidyltransferase
MKNYTKEDITKTMNRKRDILKKYGIRKISLFGSYIRNEQKDSSDIDFLVEFESPISIFQHVHLMNELEQLFGRKVEVVSVKALRPILRENILKEAVEV